MATIPADGRIFFAGAHASIPAGWARDTDFDGKYLEGADASYAAPSNGGNASHAHTMTNHTHVEDTHTHTLTSDSGTSVVATTPTAGTNQGFPPASGHAHDFGQDTPASTANYQAATVTIANADNGAGARELIVIKPDDGLQQVPNDCVIFGVDATVPAGYTLADGGGSTVDVVGASGYVRSPDAGGDAGAQHLTEFHIHTTTAHKHTAGTHTHGDTLSSRSNISPINTAFGTGQTGKDWQHHLVPVNATTAPDTSTASPDLIFASREPIHTELVPYHNVSGDTQNVPLGGVIAFVGDFASIPEADGWRHLDGAAGTIYAGVDLTDRFVKGATSSGTQAGSNTHSHVLATHSHTISGTHTHTAGVPSTPANVTQPSGGSTVEIEGGNHGHTWTFTAESLPNLTGSEGTTDTVDHRPEFRKVLWIVLAAPVTVHILGGVHIKGLTHIL